jgi:Arc/MetJ family transcription regulator
MSMCIVTTVRTNIEIDDELLAEAQRYAGTPTKRATVDLALRELVRRRERQKVLELSGTVQWHGDLDRSRAARRP